MDMECDHLSHNTLTISCLSFALCHLERKTCQKVLVKLENVLEQKFQLYNLVSKKKNVFNLGGAI